MVCCRYDAAIRIVPSEAADSCQVVRYERNSISKMDDISHQEWEKKRANRGFGRRRRRHRPTIENHGGVNQGGGMGNRLRADTVQTHENQRPAEAAARI